MDLTIGPALAAMAAAAVGATLQGSLGFGMNLVLVPVLALVLPTALPVTVIVLGLPVSISMVRHERRALDWAGARWIVAGRIPGTILATWVIATVTASTLQVLVGGIVLALVAVSVVTPPVPVRRSTGVAAGLVSGFTGTSAGIGGPPLALLYQHHPGPAMRATLAASFMFGTTFSLGALGAAHELGVDQVLLGVGLTPVVIVGVVAGRRLHGLLEGRWLRPAVLVFAGITSVAALAHALA